MYISKEDVLQYLRYESDTGMFYWVKNINSRGPSKIGQIVGCPNTIGYWQIGLFGCRLLGHRLAWLVTYGYDPEVLDHINGNRSDNRISNLRECTHAQNLAAAKKNSLGYEIHGAKYRVRINVEHVRHEIGSFDTPEEATAAYQTARHNLLGEFA